MYAAVEAGKHCIGVQSADVGRINIKAKNISTCDHRWRHHQNLSVSPNNVSGFITLNFDRFFVKVILISLLYFEIIIKPHSNVEKYNFKVFLTILSRY